MQRESCKVFAPEFRGFSVRHFNKYEERRLYKIWTDLDSFKERVLSGILLVIVIDYVILFYLYFLMRVLWIYLMFIFISIFILGGLPSLIDFLSLGIEIGDQEIKIRWLGNKVTLRGITSLKSFSQEISMRLLFGSDFFLIVLFTTLIMWDFFLVTLQLAKKLGFYLFLLIIFMVSITFLWPPRPTRNVYRLFMAFQSGITGLLFTSLMIIYLHLERPLTEFLILLFIIAGYLVAARLKLNYRYITVRGIIRNEEKTITFIGRSNEVERFKRDLISSMREFIKSD